MIKKVFLKNFIFCLLFSIIFYTNGVSFVNADNTENKEIEDLKAKIEERNTQIKQLEQEINTYNAQAEQVGNEAKTLQNTLKTLDLTQKKLSKDITLTQNKIIKANLTIDEVNKEIKDTKQHIEVNLEAISDAVRSADSLDNANILMQILSNKNIREVWNDIDNITTVRDIIRNKSKELNVLKSGLEDKQNILLGQKKTLVNLKQDLNGKKEVVLSTTQEKAALLVQTKNQEQIYRQLVQKKEDLKTQFEKEVFDFESQLNITVDKSKYPSGQHGILSWPLENVFITQKFGKTVGAEKLYVSGSHNGIDFRASVGTRVKNVLEGTVVGTGNTDAYPGCYSFGKWVMIKHENGLSTVYAHLSVVSVSIGQKLSTGDLVGFSGNTGHSTGPHLHLGVYATEGVRIEKFVSSRGCKQAVMPLADIKAYLDPMEYLPTYK